MTTETVDAAHDETYDEMLAELRKEHDEYSKNWRFAQSRMASFWERYQAATDAEEKRTLEKEHSDLYAEEVKLSSKWHAAAEMLIRKMSRVCPDPLLRFALGHYQDTGATTLVPLALAWPFADHIAMNRFALSQGWCSEYARGFVEAQDMGLIPRDAHFNDGIDDEDQCWELYADYDDDDDY
jgi:hypothetical protein